MLTQNQRSIIDRLTQEFLDFNEGRKVVNKSFNFFDTSILDSENEYAEQQIAEAKIVNKSVFGRVMDIFKSDLASLKEDLPKISVGRGGTYASADAFDGLPKWDSMKIATLSISDGKVGKILIEYIAEGNRFTAANGAMYTILNGRYKVVYLSNWGSNIVAPTLGELFAERAFVEKMTNLYKSATNSID